MSNTHTAAPAAADLSPIVKALEAAYRRIQKVYPDAPNVAIVVKRDARAWGHTTVNHVWHSHEAADVADLHEVMISGENLDRGAVAVVATLLHEAAHARNLANAIRDTDVNGRHNGRFKATAEEMGLTVAMYDGKGAYLGWTHTTLDDAGQKRWAAVIKLVQGGIEKAAKAKHPEAVAVATTGPIARPLGGAVTRPVRGGRRTLIKAECDCGASIRVSQKVLDTCAPTCQVCEAPFTER